MTELTVEPSEDRQELPDIPEQNKGMSQTMNNIAQHVCTCRYMYMYYQAYTHEIYIEVDPGFVVGFFMCEHANMSRFVEATPTLLATPTSTCMCASLISPRHKIEGCGL